MAHTGWNGTGEAASVLQNLTSGVHILEYEFGADVVFPDMVFAASPQIGIDVPWLNLAKYILPPEWMVIIASLSPRSLFLPRLLPFHRLLLSPLALN
jgi:hypothetical protein